MPEEIETRNDFLLGSNGDTVAFLLAPARPGGLDKETALRTAAWLVALTDPLQERFPEVLKTVMNT